MKKIILFEWKQFKRSSYFQKGIAIKILLFFIVLYFGGAFLIFSSAAYYILQDIIPNTNPLEVVNKFLLYILLADLVFRYLLQQLPVLNVKPYMILPIKQKTIINYILGKSVYSIFNIALKLLFLPFSIVLLIEGYPILSVLGWFSAIMFLGLSNNFLNFLINKSRVYFYSILGLLLVLSSLEYFEIYKISEDALIAFNTLFENPLLTFIPLGILLVLYRLNYLFIKRHFYLDGLINKKEKQGSTRDFSWLNRFGSFSSFLKNDLKLILRNKRPRQTSLMSFLFLFYGLIFYTNDTYAAMPSILVFASLFITGGFLMTFGQLVPSWDSEYYKFLMSQNISYRNYLESKWLLMIVVTLVLFILSTPYLYFGLDIYLMIAASTCFNIGITSFVTLLGGALNRVPIELNVKVSAFGNTSGFNLTQLLISLPKILLPVLVFYVSYLIGGMNVGVGVLAITGLTGILFKGYFLRKIELIYQKGKYKTVAAYSESN